MLRGARSQLGHLTPFPGFLQDVPSSLCVRSAPFQVHLQTIGLRSELKNPTPISDVHHEELLPTFQVGPFYVSQQRAD